MAKKKIFNPIDIIDLTAQPRIINIPAPQLDPVEEEIIYEGPSIEEIEGEIIERKTQWEEEKKLKESELEYQSREIIENAKQEAEAIRREANEYAQKIRESADDEIAKIKTRAEAESEELLNKGRAELGSLQDKAQEEGLIQGRELGYKEGFEEVQRLTKQLHNIIASTIQKRNEIIESLETELIDLTLIISRKVIKILSENQRNIVVHNVMEALQLLQSRGAITIRINPNDLDVITQNKQKFIEEIEKLEAITIVEDNHVDLGGAIIETDFGEIDARITTQLREIEDKIAEIRPLKKKKSTQRLVEEYNNMSKEFQEDLYSTTEEPSE